MRNVPLHSEQGKKTSNIEHRTLNIE